MTSLLTICRCSAVFVLTFIATNAQAVTIDWTLIGAPGNSADTTLMNDGTTGYGSVSSSYKIGTYEVTNSQYVEFLNLKDSSGANALGLYNTGMSNAQWGGITFDPAALSGNKYSVMAGDGNRPVNYVNWFDAARFTNWLNNGQGNGDTETGAYTLLGGTPVPSNATSIVRNPVANIFLPSENEWYKAAFYDPQTNSYFAYPTSSNTAPTGNVPTSAANSANYNSAVSHPTDVGAYSGTQSPFGVFDMGGNVDEWDDTLINGTLRGLRGGSFFANSLALGSSGREPVQPTFGDENIGFRVASIPEPSAYVLAALGGLALLARRWRRSLPR